MSKRDVQLVVRAKDQASRTFENVAAAMGEVYAAQGKMGSGSRQTSSDLARATKAVLDIEKALGVVAPASDKADAAFKRQQKTLAATIAQRDALRKQAAGARGALDNEKSSLVDDRLAGGDGAKQIARIKAIETAIASLTAEEARLTSTISAQKAQLGQAEAGLTSMAARARALTDALAAGKTIQTAHDEAKLAEASELSAQALRDEAAAARELANQRANLAKFDAHMGISDNPRGKQAGASARVFEASFADQSAAQALRDRIDPLSAVTRKYNTEVQRTNDLHKRGLITTRELERAQAMLADELRDTTNAMNAQGGAADDEKLGMFGLKPYELQNLGYQINDVFTQLASGAPVTQVIAQQAGQILQLFKGVGSTIMGLVRNPYLIAVVATLGSLAAVLKRASDNAKELKSATGFLERIGNTDVSASQFVEMSEAIRDIGVVAGDATKMVEAFLTKGLNPDRILDMAKATRDLADATGRDLSEAQELVVSGFSGSYDSIVELDNATQAYTLSELDRIKALYDAGDAEEARALALDLFSGKMESVAEKTRGPWSKSVQHLKNAWDDFLDGLGDSGPIQTLSSAWERFTYYFARGIERLVVSSRYVTTVWIKLKRAMPWNQGAEDQARLAAEYAEAAGAYNRAVTAYNNKSRPGERGVGDTIDADSEAQRKRNAAEKAKLADESRAMKATTDRQKIELAGEEALKKARREGFSEEVAQESKRLAMAKKRAEIEKQNAKEKKKTYLALPTDGAVTSEYGMRTHPLTGKRKRHNGIDYGANRGLDIKAGATGVVAEVKFNDGPNGNKLVIDYGNGVTQTLIHLKSIAVKKNDAVTRGQVVAQMGDTGAAKGVHLHEQLRQGKKLVNPRSRMFELDGDEAIGSALLEQEKAEEKRAEQQEDFNKSLDAENRKRNESADLARDQLKLSTEQRLAAERQYAIDKAIAETEERAAKNNLTFSKKQRAEVEASAAAEWDAANAREAASARVEDYQREREALLQLRDDAAEAGDMDALDNLERQIGLVDAALQAAIASEIKFWEGFQTEEARAKIASLRGASNKITSDARTYQREGADARLNGLQSVRGELENQLRFFADQGNGDAVENLRAQIEAVDNEILSAIDHLIEFYRVSSSPEAQAMVLQLENLRLQTLAMQDEFHVTATQIQEAFAGSLSNGVRTFSQTLVDTRNPLEALWRGAATFAADFLMQIAEIILQIAAMKLAMKIGFGKGAGAINGLFDAAPMVAAGGTLTVAGATLTGAGGTLTTAAGIWTGVATQIMAAAQMLAIANAAGSAGGAGFGVMHSGGVVGQATRRRIGNPAWFVNAQRLHSGGIPGLKSNEIPTILERNEEVITRSDSRHVLNGGKNAGKGGSPAKSIRNVLVLNKKDLAGALAGSEGEEVILNIIRNNRDTVRQELS